MTNGFSTVGCVDQATNRVHVRHCSKHVARCSSVVRAFAYSAIGRRIDPSWVGPIELFLVPASAP